MLFIMLSAVALFTPYVIFIGELTTIAAIAWIVMIRVTVSFIFLQQTFVTMPFWILRVIFVYQTHRFYYGKTTERSVLAMGLISELTIFVYFIVGSLAILWDPQWPIDPKFPIPILFIVVVLLLKYKPPFEKEGTWPEKLAAKQQVDKE